MPYRTPFLEDIVDSFVRKSTAHDINASAKLLKETFRKAYPSSDSMRLPAEILLLNFFARPAQLFILGQYPATYLETYALLERFALIEFPRCLSEDYAVQQELETLVERRTLYDISSIFVATNRWNNECLQFVKKFKKIRDAIAHKNETNLNKALGIQRSNDQFSHWENNHKFKTENTLYALLDSIDLTLRLNRFRRTKSWRKLDSIV